MIVIFQSQIPIVYPLWRHSLLCWTDRVPCIPWQIQPGPFEAIAWTAANPLPSCQSFAAASSV